MLKFSCNRFSRLLFDRGDRALSGSEELFFNSHLAKCEACWQKARTEEAALLDLRMLTEDPEPSEGFDDRILKAFRDGPKPLSLGYWSPALMGAAIAGIALLATLTVVSRTADSPVRHTPGGDAMRLDQRFSAPEGYPDLNLDSKLLSHQ
jgi:hypothetical protein